MLLVRHYMEGWSSNELASVCCASRTRSAKRSSSPASAFRRLPKATSGHAPGTGSRPTRPRSAERPER
jgi:hypothetical protein